MNFAVGSSEATTVGSKALFALVALESLDPAMAFFLPDTVDAKYRTAAWVMVVLLYGMPAAYLCHRCWVIMENEQTALSMTRSTDYGHLPDFFVCSGQATSAPKALQCQLTSFTTANKTWAATPVDQGKQHAIQQAAKSPVKQFCPVSGYNLTESVQLNHIHYRKYPIIGECAVLVVSKLKPNVVDTPAQLYYKFVTPGVHESDATLILRVHDERQHRYTMTTLTAFTPGVQVVHIKKRREGSKRLSAHPSLHDFAQQITNLTMWKSLYQVLIDPPMSNVYTSQLEYQYPDMHTESVGNLTVQHYQVTLKLMNDYVDEEVEVGRFAQIFMLLAKIGGYLPLSAK